MILRVYLITRILAIISVILICGMVNATGGNLTFSGVPPTVIPATYGDHFTEIQNDPTNWTHTASVIPRPIVDYFGENSTFGWNIFFLTIFGVMFIIMFGRQANVIIPVLTFICIGFVLLTYIPKSFYPQTYAMLAASVMGVFIFLARRKR